MSTCTSTQHCPLFSLLLLLLLLSLLSPHACTARRLAAVDALNKSLEKPRFTNTGTDVNITVAPEVKSFLSSNSKPVLEVKEITVETKESPKQYNTKAAASMKNASSKKRRGSTSGGADDQKKRTRSDEHPSVSWRVPRKKRGIQKQSEIDMDYSLPKAHPPHHN